MKCCSIKSGEMRNRISVFAKSRTLDDLGGFVETLTERFQAWAKVRNKSGSERYFNDKLNGTYTYEFTIRFVAGMLETDRIEYDGETYNVQSILNIEERNRFLTITASRGVAQ